MKTSPGHTLDMEISTCILTHHSATANVGLATSRGRPYVGGIEQLVGLRVLLNSVSFVTILRRRMLFAHWYYVQELDAKPLFWSWHFLYRIFFILAECSPSC